MENQRLILLIALAGIGLMLYFSWEREQMEPVQEPATAEESVAGAESAADAEAPASPGRTGAPGGQAAPAESAQAAPVVQEGSGPRVEVETDLLSVEISAQGGDLRKVELLEHRKEADGAEPFRLMGDASEPFYIAQSGLSGAELAPGQEARFEADSASYELGPDREELEVPLVWSQDGLEIRKVYTFHRGSYLVDVRHEVRNASGEPWRGFQYLQLRRQPDPQGMTPWYIRTFTGGALYTPAEQFSRIPFDEMAEENLSKDVTNGWGGILQHYFIGVIIPERDTAYRFYTRSLPNDTYVLGASSPWLEVPAGESGEVANRLYVGPKEQDRLTAIDAQDLRLTVDYGFLTILANPLFWALNKVQDVVKNWGAAIIVLTLLIKLAFYKLSAISYRSMAKMRKVQPKMQEIRERYADDRQQMNQALMELYKKEKINPLGGCLPILVQIPVFIALYWVLLESVEIRHAPFMLWIQDLSSRDPYFILPLLMGATMLLQMRLNPPPVDPIQKRVMQVLPFVFTGFFMLFPAGLVLYWLTNNLLSIAQQWHIMRSVEKAE